MEFKRLELKLDLETIYEFGGKLAFNRTSLELKTLLNFFIVKQQKSKDFPLSKKTPKLPIVV